MTSTTKLIPTAEKRSLERQRNRSLKRLERRRRKHCISAAAISVQGVIMTMIALLQSVRRKQEGKTNDSSHSLIDSIPEEQHRGSHFPIG